MLKINLQFFADNMEAPDWIKKLEQADREGKTPQSSANNTIASAANTSSNSKTSSSLSNNNGTSNRDTLINQYANAMKKQRLADLQNAYNNTLNKIAEQERQVGQTAQANRNQASVQSQLAQRNLANYMANAGLTNSGTNAQMMINNSGALQNTLGGITQNEQNTLNQLANQRALAYQNLQNDTASANAGIDAQLLNNQINYLDQLNQLRMQQDYNTRMAQQQRDWAVEDRNYNTDVNNIWDDKLGRYVSQSMYLQTHPEVVPQYYTGGSSSANKTTNSTSNARQLSALSDAKYLDLRKDYEGNLNPDNLTFEQWAYENRGYGDPSVYLASLGRYNEYGKAIVNDILNGEESYETIKKDKQKIEPFVGSGYYREILNFAKALAK